MLQIAELLTRIAALGDRDLAHLTHREIDAAMRLVPEGVEFRWVATDSAEARRIDGFDGLWVLPGTPYRDNDVVYAAIRFAREQGMPMLGTCRWLSVHGGRKLRAGRTASALGRALSACLRESQRTR